MFTAVLPAIEAVFSKPGETGPAVEFEWRLIRRNRRPFLLLPGSGMDARVGLELYSAQRRRAKIFRRVFPWLLKTPAADFFSTVRLRVDAGSEIMSFLAQQSGVPAATLHPPAIKFGGQGPLKSRLVLLLTDETFRPVRVVKLGLNAEGRATIDREADFLERLPPDTLGCIRLTGRLTTPGMSAFATAYFPGHSPVDDAGMEHLFHAWLNSGPPVPIKSLPTWHELESHMPAANPAAWQFLQAALGDRNIRSTLHHGDFAPWNIRAVNARNLQVYDWERGHLQGLPGWDWFHFVVQTSILARRHSIERVAAEIEELLYSPRFQKYAADAGIRDLLLPLLMGYLLHQKYVVKPREGADTAANLYELLAGRWQMPSPAKIAREPSRSPAVTAPAPALPKGLKGLWVSARYQLRAAATQLTNLFWEPTLTSSAEPSLRTQFFSSWPVILGYTLLLAVVVVAHFFANPHFLFLSFYAVPCILLTWKLGRQWGGLLATVAAVAGPVVVWPKDTDFQSFEVTGWNLIMRFVTLQFCVLLTDRIRHKNKPVGSAPNVAARSGKLSENWAVALACNLWFAIVLALQLISNPNLFFLPLYLLPCVVLTLAVNRRIGIFAALFVAAAGSLVQRLGDVDYQPLTVVAWNISMRFMALTAILLLLDYLRKDNVLLASPKPENS